MKVVCLLVFIAVGAHATNQGYVSSKQWLPREPATLTAEQVSGATLPVSFDWREKGLVTADWNQHIPEYCGSCWIHGTLSALNDRIKIRRNGTFPDVMLGRQAVTNCVPDANGQGKPPGCNGGDPYMIHKYMSEHKVPDESCMPYQAKNMGCTADTVCRNCKPEGGCWAVDHYIGYGVRSFGSVKGEAAMMKEIHARGPLACSFACDDDFMFNFTENVMAHDGVYTSSAIKTADDIDHIMEITGWGETVAGVKYWMVRNSWGTYWGNGGWAKIKKGTLMAEYECDWAEPEFDDLGKVLAGSVMGDYVHGIAPVRSAIKSVSPSQLVV